LRLRELIVIDPLNRASDALLVRVLDGDQRQASINLTVTTQIALPISLFALYAPGVPLLCEKERCYRT
jgi:hypothetical protein